MHLLLLAVLAAPASAGSPADLPPEEIALIRIEQKATAWQDWQVRSTQMENAYVQEAAAASNDRSIYCFTQNDRAEVVLERNLRDWRESRLASWKAQAAAGTITEDESDRRAGFLDRLFKLRMLWVYGSMSPRIIQFCSDGDDEHAESHAADSKWGIAAFEKDFWLADKELRRISGLSEEDTKIPGASDPISFDGPPASWPPRP